MTVEELLNANIREFYTQGKEALARSAFNSAVSLFFKALAVMADLVIFRKEGAVPKSHADRFRILEKKYTEVYAVLDKNFPAYQDSYNIKLSKELAEVIERDVRALAEKVGFQL